MAADVRNWSWRVPVALVAAVVGMLPATGAAQAVTSFGPPQEYSVEGFAPPVDITAGDFDGDGKLDLATANVATGQFELAVLFGRGNGTFEDAAFFDTLARPISIASADLNGDGRSDLVLPADADNQVSVYLGAADRSFDVTDYPMSGTPVSVAIGDFDGNGQKDIATSGNSVVSVRLSAGAGTFGAEQSYPGAAVAAGLGWIEAGDFDGNGRDDLALIPGSVNITPAVAILRSNADGTLQPLLASDLSPSSCCAFDLVAGRFDADAATDLAVNYAFTSEISVMRANGDGTMALVRTLAPPPPGRTGRLAVGDFGAPSLVAPGLGVASIFQGNGDTTFGPRTDVAVPGSLLSAAVARDLNGDGLDDLALADMTGGVVSVLLNGYTPPPVSPAPPSPPAKVVDKSAPKVKLTYARRQGIDRLVLSVVLDEPGTVSARATVNVPGASRVHRFKRVTRSAKAGATVRLRLKLASRSRRAVVRALRKRKKLTVRATVTSRDTAGNSRTNRPRVRLKR